MTVMSGRTCFGCLSLTACCRYSTCYGGFVGQFLLMEAARQNLHLGFRAANRRAASASTVPREKPEEWPPCQAHKLL